MSPALLVELALKAGRHALQRAGADWHPEDLTVTTHPGQPIVFRLCGFRRIELGLNPALLLHHAALLARPGQEASVPAVIEKVVWSWVRLFTGFYSECPRDGWGHAELVSAAGSALLQIGRPPQERTRVADAIVAFFEHAVVSRVLAQREGERFVSGLAMEWQINQPNRALLSSLQQRLLLLLSGTAAVPTLTLQSLRADPTADALLPDVLFILFGARLRLANGQVLLSGKVRSPLSIDWPRKVVELTRLLAPHLDPQPSSSQTSPNPFAQPTSSSPRGEPNDTGTPPQDLAQNSGIGPSLLGCPSPDPLGSAGLPGSGGGPEAGLEDGRTAPGNFEALDRYYSQCAHALQVRDRADEAPPGPPALLEVGCLAQEPATFKDLLSGQINWFGTRWSPPSADNPAGLLLERLAEPLLIPERDDHPEPESVPNMLLLVDSSGSMQFNPAAAEGARGKYDLVLRACWGIFRFLESQPARDRVWINAINFSRRTRSSGWHPFGRLETVKRTLVGYQGGGTVLETEMLQTASVTSPGRFLAIVMTDGCLGNTPQALAALERLLTSGNSLALLHIGAPNDFTHGVTQMGAIVRILSQASELVGVCLDIARQSFNNPSPTG